MTDLQDLAQRVEMGAGPDRELDALILCAIFAPAGSKVEQSTINGAWCIYSIPSHGRETWRAWEGGGNLRQAAFTTSLDAVVALLERVLPGWNGHVSTTGRAAVDRLDPHSRFEASGSSPARALLAATLRALSKEPRHEG